MSERVSSSRRLALVVGAAAVAALVVALGAGAGVGLTRVDSDPFTNASSQHRTQVEPDSYAAGSTIVVAVQSGRFFDGGASDIDFATSTNAGSTWTSGSLPSTTAFSSPAGPYARVSDPSVAFDPRHGVWLIASLALQSVGGGVSGAAVIVSRSTDGGLSWGSPVVAATGGNLDKSWIACDGTATSPFYGSCYVEYDDNGAGNRLHMAYSRDGALTWKQGSVPAATALGGQPLVRPNGTVIMPTADGSVSSIVSFRSTDGGVTWSGPTTIASITDHFVAGGLRDDALPSAEIDGKGKVYVAWQDCRFRTGCSSNDIVFSKSSDGLTWTTPRRVKIDPRTSTVDHFIPGIAIDKSTSGSTAHVGLAYYFYPNASCTTSTCQLEVGYVSSLDAGQTWSAPTVLAGPMSLSWLPSTSLGRMVGDYISTSFVGGAARPVFTVANHPTAGGADCAGATPNCDQATYTSASGLGSAPAVSGPGLEAPVAGAASDHPAPAEAPTAR